MELKVMLVTGSDGDPRISELLAAEGEFTVVGECAATDDLLGSVRRWRPDVILVSAPRPDAEIFAKVEAVRGPEPCAVAMICERRDSGTITAAVKAGVDALATAGLPEDRLGAVVELAFQRFNETHRLLQERDRATQALAERKLVERAKGIIMKQRGLDEAAAYTFMRQAAMNRNVRLGQLAASIIEAEELLH